MEAEEKAKQLVEKFKLEPIKPLCIMHPQHSKQCALICVDEILNSNPCIEDYGGDGWILVDNSEYWKEVKEEIKRL
jgi:hypothetical protein